MRAHFHLLSDATRRGTGGSRAGLNQRPSNLDPDLSTGRPMLRELRAICACDRLQVDLAQPGHSTGWLADHVIRERLSILCGDIRVRVARRPRQLASAAVFRVMGPDERWVLESLSVRDREDGAAVDAVLRQAVRDAGATGSRRLFARLPADAVVDGALRRSGFVPFTTERVFVLDGDAKEAPAPVPALVRRVQPADVWGIHQLYLEVVPRQVQYAEAVTSRAWERSRPLRPGACRSSGWVIEDHGRVRGYVRASTEDDLRVIHLDLLIDPDMRKLVPELIAAVKSEARNLHGVPCVVSVPGYRHELSGPLLDAGFRSFGDQTAWVCYTTVPARSYIVAVNPGSATATEPQRARVPGFGGAGMSIVDVSASSEGT